MAYFMGDNTFDVKFSERTLAETRILVKALRAWTVGSVFDILNDPFGPYPNVSEAVRDAVRMLVTSKETPSGQIPPARQEEVLAIQEKLKKGNIFFSVIKVKVVISEEYTALRHACFFIIYHLKKDAE